MWSCLGHTLWGSVQEMWLLPCSIASYLSYLENDVTVREVVCVDIIVVVSLTLFSVPRNGT